MAKSPKALQPVRTRVESAKAAGVGEHKYNDGAMILAAVESGEAAPELLDKVRAGEISIHRAAGRAQRAETAGTARGAAGRAAFAGEAVSP